MKKFLTVAVAVLIVALSVIPAFAAPVESPTAKPTSYVVDIAVGVEGGYAVADYKTDIDEDGKQTIGLTAVPYDGYVFLGWDIDGEIVSSDDLTKAQIELIISGDIHVYPVFAKKGSPDETRPIKPHDGKDKTVDGGSKSPKTGSQDAVPFIVLGLSAAALTGVIITAKRRSAKK